jgi:tetratricopeptide (TPR) repeat protein
MAWIFYFIEKDYDNSKACDKAIDINSTYIDAHNNIGKALNSLGRYDEAIRCYDKVLSISPNNPRILHNRAHSNYLKRDFVSMFADLDTSKEYFKLAREDKAFESVQK